MLEILFVIYLFRKFKRQSDAKHRSKWLPWIVPLFWFGGEFTLPFLVGFGFALFGRYIESPFYLYGIAFLGGILGACIAFLFVRMLPPKTLACPKCGWEFTKASKFGVDCGGCTTRLKVVEGRVLPVEPSVS